MSKEVPDFPEKENKELPKLFKHEGTTSKITDKNIISLDSLHQCDNMFILIQPFIYTGYRVYYTINDCINSLFEIHNETMNIWTHLLTFFAYTIILCLLLIGIF